MELKIIINEFKEENNIKYYTGGNLIYSVRDLELAVDFIRVDNGSLFMEGHIPMFAFINKDEFEISAKIEAEYIRAVYNEDVELSNQVIALNQYYFKVKVPLSGG